MRRRKTKPNIKIRRSGNILLSPLLWKAVLIVTVGLLVGSAALYSYRAATRMLTVKEVVVTGNRHLSKNEIRTLMKIGNSKSIITMDLAGMRMRLLQSKWIKDAVIRKELPHTVVVRVTEAEPAALLKKDGALYILSREGVMIERLTQTAPFLPVIEIKSGGDASLKEAIKLVSTIREEGVFSGREIDITAISPEDMTLKVDSLTIKVGGGEYKAKLLRLIQVQEEIVKRGVPVDYIDLRFSKRVIVRPEKESSKSE